ncbi:MAG: hypothetical protein WC627_10860 [Legionella sp.]|jgi:hypothetical protein
MTPKKKIAQALTSKHYEQILPILKANKTDSSIINAVFKDVEIGNEMSLAMILVTLPIAERPKELVEYVLTHKSLDLHYVSDSTLLREIAIYGDIESFKLLMKNPDIYFDNVSSDTNTTILTYSLFKKEEKYWNDLYADHEDYKKNIQLMIKAIRYISYDIAIKTNNKNLLNQLLATGDSLTDALENPFDETASSELSSSTDELTPLMLLCNSGDLELWESIIIDPNEDKSNNLNEKMIQLRELAYLKLTQKIEHAKEQKPTNKALINSLEIKRHCVYQCIYKTATQKNNMQMMQKLHEIENKIKDLLINPCDKSVTGESSQFVVENPSAQKKKSSSDNMSLTNNSIFKTEKTDKSNRNKSSVVTTTVDNEVYNYNDQLRNNYNYN